MKLLHGFSSPTFVRYGATGAEYLPSVQISAASFQSPSTFSYPHVLAGDILRRWTLGPIHIPLLLRLANPYYKIGISHWLRDPKGFETDGTTGWLRRCTGVTFQVGWPTG